MEFHVQLAKKWNFKEMLIFISRNSETVVTTKARFLQLCHLTPLPRAVPKQHLVPVENYMLHFLPLQMGL